MIKNQMRQLRGLEATKEPWGDEKLNIPKDEIDRIHSEFEATFHGPENNGILYVTTQGVRIEMNDLQLGDVVKLKSGGPWMTISLLQGDHYIEGVTCQWFELPNQGSIEQPLQRDGDCFWGSLQTACFAKESLIRREKHSIMPSAILNMEDFEEPSDR